MSEISKPKKIRIYKFASEYNLPTDAIVEFLKEKDYKVKSHASPLTEEMIEAVRNHFKKDIEKSERHYRKISDFQKSLGREDSTEEEELEEVEVVEEQAEEEKSEDIVDEKVDDKEAVVIEESEAEEETIDEPPVVEKEKIFQTEGQKQIERNKAGGLKVLGKIELKEKPRPSKKAVKEKADEKSKKDSSSESDSKKKKVFKAKNKSRAIEVSEEIKKAKKKKRVKRFEVDKKQVDANIRRTLHGGVAATGYGGRAAVRKKKRKEKKEILEVIEEQKQIERETKIQVTEFISVNELANLMDVGVGEVIAKCMTLGLMVSINQRLDVDTITLISEDLGFEVEFQEEFESESLVDIEDDESTLEHRAPIVTIMGHVDHGKTSLLDYIRKENVVAGEAGGITQHIGAYKVEVEKGKSIAFLDTPGHEAFTAMRARGASVTDIVILIVAADDAVMPQTVEAINHSLAAGVPIIVAINKIDTPGANVDKIKQQLADRDILVEEWGGKYQAVEISAMTGANIDLLLEKILLEAELLDLKANYNRVARGTVIEAQLDKGRGVTSTVLIQKGTLKVGDPFVAGNFQGRVRAMFDERNKKVKEVGPSTPVLVLGFEGTPQAGDSFVVVNSEREAREVSTKRQQLHREQSHRQIKMVTLDEIASRIGKGEIKDLPIIVKGDVDGSVEALSDSLMKLTNDEVRVQVIHKGVGAISESDVLLAQTSGAIIVGFHVRPHLNARRLAEKENVDIRLYSIIYDVINEVKSALEGMLSPIITEKLVATIEVRETFKVPKVGTVAGCYVQDGKINRNHKIKLFRESIVIYEGELATLKRFKDDVKEVDAGYECGLNISNFNDIKVLDIIEAYETVETKKKLEI